LTTFAALFVPESIRDAVSDRAWLEAMLQAERALVPSLEIPDLELEALLVQGRATANPVEPLVRALRERTPEAHRGATSQDILDTAAMLVARNAVGLVLESLQDAGDGCARLVDAHRLTPMAARTLLQQAVPTTFGAVAGGWLVLLAQARDRLRRLSFPAQLGGAAGTLAAFGDDGLDTAARFAAALELAEPVVPWHVNRAPVAEIGFALEQAAAAAATIGLDVVLLSQTEVGEVREASGGASSTMPHKRNPARAVIARACARGVLAQTPLLRGGDYELQRAAGAWQAEWNALSEALALCGGAVAAIGECLAGLEVDADAMHRNMRDDLYSERDRLGLEGDYLGAAPQIADRAVTLWRS
jgi:3-carboxy-cis,cis-muconate cycloisomerase